MQTELIPEFFEAQTKFERIPLFFFFFFFFFSLLILSILILSILLSTNMGSNVLYLSISNQQLLPRVESFLANKLTASSRDEFKIRARRSSSSSSSTNSNALR